MSAEIKATLNLNVTNGNFSDRFQGGTISIDQASVGGGNPGTVTIGTSEEDISFGDVAPGIVAVKNLDETNYVEWGPKSGSSMVLVGPIMPGEVAFFRADPTTILRMKAHTAPVNVLIKGYNP
jgi:hypothetical protein